MRLFLQGLLVSSAFLAVMLAVSWGQSPDSPRRLRLRSRRIVMFWWLPLCLIVVATQVYYYSVSIATFGMGLWAVGMVIWLFWPAGGHVKPPEALANYARDPMRCGQCEYDLTGNASGICPECGWQIPKDVPPPAPVVPWTHWHKCWRIERLDDWRKKRNSVAIWAAVFAVVAIVSGLLHSTIGIAVGAQLCLGFLINVVRATAYGRRHRQDAGTANTSKSGS
jgi:hypothetical protein